MRNEVLLIIFFILIGWGKHSKVVDNGVLKKVVEALINGMDSTFHTVGCNLGRFISEELDETIWLRQPRTLNVLLLYICIINSQSVERL